MSTLRQKISVTMAAVMAVSVLGMTPAAAEIYDTPLVALALSDFCDEMELSVNIEGIAVDFDNVTERFLAEYPEKTELIYEATSNISRDINLVAGLVYDTENALESYENYLMSVLRCNESDESGTLEAYANGYYSSQHYIPTVTQLNGYYCGPASTIEALLGNGDISSSDYRNGYDDFQKALAKEMGTTQGSGTYVYKLTGVLNNYSQYTYTYDYYTANNYTDCITKLINAFYAGRTPIIYFSDTSALDYYSGTPQIHYIAVTMIDTVHKTLLLVDPNNNSTYNGEHTITYDELYEAMQRVSSKNTNAYIIG